MRFIECEGQDTYINTDSIETIWSMINPVSGTKYCLLCKINTGEDYVLYEADKEKIDYLKSRLVLALTRESLENGIIDLDAL